MANTCLPALRPATQPFARGTTGVSYVRRSDHALHPHQQQPGAGRRPSGHRRVHGHHRGATARSHRRDRRQHRHRHIDVGTVVDPSAWVPDNYTLRFTSADRLAGRRGRHRADAGAWWRPARGFASGQYHQLPRRAASRVDGHAGRGRHLSAIQPAQEHRHVHDARRSDHHARAASGDCRSDRAVFQHADRREHRRTSTRASTRAVDRARRSRHAAASRSTRPPNSRDDRSHRLQSAAVGSAGRGLRRGHQQAEPAIAGLQAAQAGLHARSAQLSLFDYL